MNDITTVAAGTKLSFLSEWTNLMSAEGAEVIGDFFSMTFRLVRNDGKERVFAMESVQQNETIREEILSWVKGCD